MAEKKLSGMRMADGTPFEEYLDANMTFDGKEREYNVNAHRENGEEVEMTVYGSNTEELVDSITDWLRDDEHDDMMGPRVLTDRIAGISPVLERENRFIVNLGYGNEAVKLDIAKDCADSIRQRAGMPLSLVYADGPSEGEKCVDLVKQVPGFCHMPYSGCVNVDGFPDAERFIKEHDLGKELPLAVSQSDVTYPVYQFDAKALQALCPDGFAAYEATKEKTPVSRASSIARENSVSLQAPVAEQETGIEM